MNCCCNISKEEKKIYDYICGLVGDENVIHNTRKLLKSGEIDIYIPNENIGIEFDGLYWHTESQGKDKSYHIKKTLEAQKLGIKIILINLHSSKIFSASTPFFNKKNDSKGPIIFIKN